MTLCQGRNEAWALTRDFNDILDNSQKMGGPARCEGSFIPFRSFFQIMDFGMSSTQEINYHGEADDTHMT